MDKRKITVELVPASEIRGAAYNPRRADDDRLAALRASLATFGWLIPAYANEDGMLLSGHQRTKVWQSLKHDKIPVVRIKGISEAKQRSLNILFNLATNDMTRFEQSAALWSKFKKRSLKKSSTLFPCINVENVPAEQLLPHIDIAEDGWQYAKALYSAGIVVPVVLGKDGKIANGRKRLIYYLRRGMKEIPTVTAPNHTAEEIAGYLNFISMNFEIRSTYEQELRFGSFRRPRLVRRHLGTGFSSWLFFKEPVRTEDVDHTDPAVQEALRKRFGTHVVDFGAGHLHEARMLEQAGISVYPFEPYHVPSSKNAPDLEKSQKLTRAFLDAVARKQVFDSVVLSSVFNSIPFIEDRRTVLTIAAALNAPVYIGTMSRNKQQYKAVSGVRASRATAYESYTQMLADYEEGVIVGDFMSGYPKAQKFHTLTELKALVLEYYGEAKGFRSNENIYVTGRHPRPLHKKELRAALLAEFNLPYSEGRTLGMGDYAVQAFTKRGLL